ncbi:hypothetical protein OGAPHI_004753 [Ogataea philodendri]|uniref:Xylulose kinase n=1 Tax=Ogataea philodendri TaxID=1378263 RepID=A0A9P8T3C3_9ASCO|nr:uncharacterized protein OGAPHI_004753 [Ogataea philodendri]KAH3664039.1 hypothetical protein OGAPHI_004753 [Ogataea philodendri]
MSLFLGFDLSTQQLKVISIHSDLSHHKTYRVEFDTELSEYGIRKGVFSNDETGEINAPVEMWVEALEMCFDKMKKDDFPFSDVKAMSGSCQQHGSVYWSYEAPELLKSLSADKPLAKQLAPNAFTFQMSPNWQDHSTGPELKIFEESVGGGDELARITGSRAHYRFTGPQIRKLASRIDPKKYHETYRISLVSSFLSSLLCCKITNIEESDGCGMNIYDIQKSQYDDGLLAVTAGVHPKIDQCSESETKAGIQELKDKLGPLDPVGHKSIGTIGHYFVSKYGFSESCKVYSFTGDNLATILALPLGANDTLISMGTSTTALLVTSTYKTSENYHIFKHPTLKDHYMGMLCYCNGALAREIVRDKLNEKYKEPKNSWDKFNSLLDKSVPLNGKFELGIYFPLGEIIPNAKPCERRFRFDVDKKELLEVEPWSIEEDVNSIIESQALSCRLRMGPLLASTSKQQLVDKYGVLSKLEKYGEIQADGKPQSQDALLCRPKKVFYVGGSSKNPSIVAKYCDILGPTEDNYKIDISDACALGGCFKSLWSFGSESGEIKDDYMKWLSASFDWNEGTEKLGPGNHWDEYADGVGIISSAEKKLES